MGNSNNNNTVNLDSISTIKLTEYKGNGIYATSLIKQGTIIKGGTLRIKDKISSMNDANFEYPSINLKTLSNAEDNMEEIIALKLRTTFGNYKLKCEIDNENNIRALGNEKYLVLRDIYPGEELTKEYGLPKWFGFIAMNFYGVNPVSPKNQLISNISTEMRDRLMSILSKCASDFDCALSVEIAKQSSGTTKM